MKLAGGFLELSSGHDEAGREFLRLEWARSQHGTASKLATALPMATKEPGAGCKSDGRPPSCSSCQWVRPDMFWCSRALDGAIIVRNAHAWSSAKCGHPSLSEGAGHLVDSSVELNRPYATTARGERGACGAAGALFEASAAPGSRAPRLGLPLVLSASPFALTAATGVLAAVPLFVLPFMVLVSGWLTFGIWHYSRRHL